MKETVKSKPDALPDTTEVEVVEEVEETEVEVEETDTEEETEEIEYVEYVGMADVRSISPGQWRAAGVEKADDAQDIVWNAENDKLVPVSDLRAFLSEDEFNRMILADRSMRVRKA